MSDTYTVPVDNPWHQVTSVIGRADAASWLTAERERGSGDILIFGSRTTWNGLLTQGLVDELPPDDQSSRPRGWDADRRGSC